MIVSERMPASCTGVEVANSGRTGMTTAYTEDMLSRENHGLHNASLTRREYNLLGARHDLEAR